MLSFDDKGNGAVLQSISKNGVISFDVDGTFTVQVAADCTGKGYALRPR
jgi:hypothetical protein